MNNSEIGEISTAPGLRKIGFRGSLRHFPEWNGVQRRPGGQGSRGLGFSTAFAHARPSAAALASAVATLNCAEGQMGDGAVCMPRRLRLPPSTFLQPLRSSQDHADVLSAAAHDRMEHVALGPHERAARQTAVALHVPDHRLDGRPAPDVPAQRRGHALPLSRNEDLGALHAMAAAALVGDGAPGSDAGHLLSLSERLCKRVAVIGRSRDGHGADDEALLVRDRQRALDSELEGHARLALGDAVDVRLVQGVELVAVVAPLLDVIVCLWPRRPSAARGAAAGADHARANASPHTRRECRVAFARSATPRSRAPRPSPAARGWLARTPARTAPRRFPAPSLRLRRPQARPPPRRMPPALACGQQGMGMPGCAWRGQGRRRSAERAANQERRGAAAIRRRAAGFRCARPRCGRLAPGCPALGNLALGNLALGNLARFWRGRGRRRGAYPSPNHGNRGAAAHCRRRAGLRCARRRRGRLAPQPPAPGNPTRAWRGRSHAKRGGLRDPQAACWNPLERIARGCRGAVRCGGHAPPLPWCGSAWRTRLFHRDGACGGGGRRRDCAASPRRDPPRRGGIFGEAAESLGRAATRPELHRGAVSRGAAI